MAAARASVSLLLLASLALPGCGGGGGGGGGTPAPSEPPAPPEPPTAAGFASHPSFRGQWGLAAIRADHAYENLAAAGEQGAEVRPGGGVSVGLIDTGIDEDHPAFAGKRINEEILQGDGDASGTGRFSHGTAVASVAAASRRDGEPFHGVAWAAGVEMFAISLGSAPPRDRPYRRIGLSGLARNDATDAEQYGDALDKDRWDFDILNLSFGYPGLIQGYDEAGLRESYSNTIAALAQAGAEEKRILVWSAGNAHGRACDSGPCVEGFLDASSPELLAGLMVRIPELRGHSVAAVAIDRDGAIASFSNRCGIAADWCIAAPGRDMAAAYWGPDREGNPYRGWTTGRGGTSYAAPMVAGALAVMRGFFDGQMGNVELVGRMFATADKSGRYADRDVYGQGLLDLGAATEPVGATSVAAGGTVWEGGAPFSATALRLGSAFGDGMARSLGGRRLMVFDELGAPFRRPLAGRVASGGADGTGDLGASLRALLAAPLSAWGGPDGAGAPRAPSSSLQHLAHVRGEGELPALRWGGDGGGGGVSGAFFSTGRGSAASAAGGGGPASGMVLSWRPSSGRLSSLRLRAGGLYEEEGLFGTSADGAFGRISNRSVFAGVERNWEEAGSGWRLSASAELGMSSPEWEGVLVSDVSPVVTSGFSLRAGRAAPWGGGVERRRRRRGWLEWSVTQPLRVERADVTLSAPVRRTPGGGVVRERWPVSAAPSGRQLDLGLRWEHPLAAHGALRLGAVRTYEPGHDAEAPPRWSLLAGLRYAF